MPKEYIPNEKEKYMSNKQKAYLMKRLQDWKNEIIKSSNQNMYLNDVDYEISSPDIIDQASSTAEKAVEMRTLNRQRKLLSCTLFIWLIIATDFTYHGYFTNICDSLQFLTF